MRGHGASTYCRRSGGTSTTTITARRSARDEQLKREKSRRRDAEFRLERLRQARGLPSSSSSAISGAASSDSPYINLFNGLADFSSLGGALEESTKYRKGEAEDGGSKKSKKQRREERLPALSPDDEKYKLRYGLAGKGVKAPWYLSMPSSLSTDDVDGGIERGSSSCERGWIGEEESREEDNRGVEGGADEEGEDGDGKGLHRSQKRELIEGFGFLGKRWQ